MKPIRVFIITIISMMIIATFLPMSFASADTYSSPWISLTATQGGKPGTALQVLGYSFAPNAGVTVSMGSNSGQLQQVATGTVGSNGSFKIATAVPADAKGGDQLTVQVVEAMNGSTINTTSLTFVVGRVSNVASNGSSLLSYGSTGYTMSPYGTTTGWFNQYGPTPLNPYYSYYMSPSYNYQYYPYLYGFGYNQRYRYMNPNNPTINNVPGTNNRTGQRTIDFGNNLNDISPRTVRP